MTNNYFIIPGIEITYEIENKAICKVYNITTDELFIKTRRRDISEARHMLMWYDIEYNGVTLHVAGNRFKKDHATANHAKNKINEMLEYDPIIQKNVNMFLSILGKKLIDRKSIINNKPFINKNRL